ncbi:MAG: SLC13 family permease [Desulfocapsaceae bacterium]
MDAIHYTFLILIITIALFIWDKLRADYVALASMSALVLGGILTPSQALKGFGDTTVVMIAALFVVGEGLSRTGVTAYISRQIISIAGTQTLRVVVVLMAGTALLSAFMSNTGTVATLLPAVIAIAWSIDSYPSKMLLPLAFAANAGGLLTLTGTPPNIVVSETLVNAGFESFDFFEYSWIGLPLLIMTIGYMAWFGQKLLPVSKSGDRPEDLNASLYGISESFGLSGKLFLASIAPDSLLAGKTLAEAGLGKTYMVTALGVEENPSTSSDAVYSRQRRLRRFLHQLEHTTTQKLPVASTKVEANTLLILKGSSKAVKKASEELCFDYEEIDLDPAVLSKLLISADVGLAEVLITPRSSYQGITVQESNLLDKFGVQVMSIRRGDALVTRRNTKLKFGDALLVRGYWHNIDLLRKERRNFTVIGSPDELSRQVVEMNWRGIIAVLCLLGMVVMMVTKVIPTVMAVLVAAMAMVLAGCLNMNQAYRSIGWQSVVLIAAMIPMSTALALTGGAELIARYLVATIGALGPLPLLAGVYILTAGFSQVLSNTATTVLIAPIVLQAALVSDLSPYPLLMMVAVGASAAFLTPISSTTNLMVLTPGGYRFNDYVKVGFPLMVLFLLVSLVIVPLVWPV